MSIYTYIPKFIADDQVWFDRLYHELAWVQREGAPRREYWTNLLDRPYTYGRGRGVRTYDAQPDHELIIAGRAAIAERIEAPLAGAFLNLYGSSRDWLGWHADDDPGIDHTKPIAVITLGQGRIIQFREVLDASGEANKGVFGDPEGIMLESGSLLLMHAGCQSTHQHRIPKASFEAKPRISLTYRALLKEKPDD